MAPSTSQVFQGVTLAEYGVLCQKAQAVGIAISGPSGQASKFGVQVGWSYEAATGNLTVTVLKDSFLMRAPAVQARIAALMLEATGIEASECS